jgi:hypothetical protein
MLSKLRVSVMKNEGENRILGGAQPNHIASMDLEQRHVIKFLDRKGLKLDSFAA